MSSSLREQPLASSAASSESGSWTTLNAERREGNVYGLEITSVLWAGAFREPIGNAVGVYAHPTSGSYLQLRDYDGNVFYTKYATEVSRVVGGGIVYNDGAEFDPLPTSLVIQFPISYFDSVGGNKIVILGKLR